MRECLCPLFSLSPASRQKSSLSSSGESSSRSPPPLSDGLEDGGSEKVSESELISSYSTRGFIVLTLGGAVSLTVENTGPGAANDSRPCLLDLCRLRFEVDEEDDMEAFECTLPPFPVMSPAEV